VVIEKTGYDYNIDIIALEIPVDNIHIVIRSEPKVSTSNIMKIIKSISVRELFRVFSETRTKYFCGGKLWRQCYFVATIGNANEENIRQYVRNQFKEMDRMEMKYKKLKLF
jgi:putative transposase